MRRPTRQGRWGQQKARFSMENAKIPKNPLRGPIIFALRCAQPKGAIFGENSVGQVLGTPVAPVTPSAGAVERRPFEQPSLYTRLQKIKTVKIANFIIKTTGGVKKNRAVSLVPIGREKPFRKNMCKKLRRPCRSMKNAATLDVQGVRKSSPGYRFDEGDDLA